MDGGARSMKIPFLRPPLNQSDIDAAVAVLKGSDLTAGQVTEEFERKFADYIGTKYAVAVNSGTSALDLIFQSLKDKGELATGDKVILPSFTFAACANVLVNNGLEPVFVDIEKRDLNMVVNDISNEINAILVVHSFGRPVGCMAHLMDLAGGCGIPLIEDCAESIGAEYRAHKVGSLGAAGAFSFIATKNMTCGEGGMITTDNWETAMIARDLRAHGIMRGRHILNTNVTYPDVIRPGYNMRMTDFQAAIGTSQLKRLDLMVNARQKNSERLSYALTDCNIPLHLLPQGDERSKFALSMFQFCLPKEYGWEARDEILRRICHAGVDARTYFNTPIHRFSYYRKTPMISRLDTTENICDRVITLPIDPNLTHDEIDFMAEAVKEACK
jgi:perosamine synthetase